MRAINLSLFDFGGLGENSTSIEYIPEDPINIFLAKNGIFCDHSSKDIPDLGLVSKYFLYCSSRLSKI